jgi:hypothetical protein
MPGTGYNESGMPLPSETITRKEPSEHPAQAALSVDQDDVLEELIDNALKFVGNDDLALEQLQAKVGQRIAKRQEWGPKAEALPNRSGGAMPMHHAPAIGGRRPFLGFDREQNAYARLKDELLARFEGKYVVFVGDDELGPFDSHTQAELAGYEKFGLGPLYIKRVQADEPAIEVTRLAVP